MSRQRKRAADIRSNGACAKDEEFHFSFLMEEGRVMEFPIRFMDLRSFRILPVDVVVQFINRPAVMEREIMQLGERRILKAETRAGIIRLRDNAHNGVHDLIQQTAMRDDQIPRRLALQQLMQRLPRPQEQFPIPFPIRADGSYGVVKSGCEKFWRTSCAVNPANSPLSRSSQSGSNSKAQVERRGDDLRRFLRAFQADWK
jgi:hypothetical protein